MIKLKRKDATTTIITFIYIKKNVLNVRFVETRLIENRHKNKFADHLSLSIMHVGRKGTREG